MIKAAIFDMDGVIINSEPIHDTVWKQFYEHHNIPVSRKDLDSMRGIPPAATIRKFMPHVTNEAALDSLHKERAELLTHAFTDKDIPLVAGIIDFMQDLRRQHIAIAVATSTLREIAEKVLQKVGVYEFLDVVVGGNDILHGKPDPEIFLTAAQKLKVDPKNCMVFEDSVAGVEAGLKAHMHVVALLTTHTQDTFPEARYFLKDFQISAKALLQKIASIS